MFCFAKFCRLCLKDSSVLINIFCFDKDNGKIVDKMKFLLPELISPLDGFPPWLCLSCRTQVNRTFNLFKKWIKSHKTLQNYIRKCNITTQVPNNTILNVQLVGINYKLEKIEKFVNVDHIKVIKNIHERDHNEENSNTFTKFDHTIYKEESDNVTDNSTEISVATKTINKNNEQQKEETNSINTLLGVSGTTINKTTEEITSSNIETHSIVPRNNSIPVLGTGNSVIEELLMMNSDEEQHTKNLDISDKPVCNSQLIEITMNEEHVTSSGSPENTFNIDNPITNTQFYVLKPREEQNFEAVSQFSNTNENGNMSITKNGLKHEEKLDSTISTNKIYLNTLTQTDILEKAIEIAKITETNKDLQLQVSTETGTDILKNNMNFMSETATQIFTPVYSQSYTDNYCNNNSFQYNYGDNNFQYTNYNKVSENNNYSINFDVKKISGYLQESYPESPSNVYCNLDDKIYYHNCDTIITNILDTATNNSSTCSPISDGVNVSNAYCPYSKEELNHRSPDVQTFAVNNSWNTFNQNQLTKDNFTPLEYIEKNLETVANLESSILKNVTIHNPVPLNYINCYSNQNNTANENIIPETNMPYTGNYASIISVNSSPISNQYNGMIYNEIYSPTLIKKDCFTFSEDSNGNEIPSKKTKVTRKRNKIPNNKENKFYQVFLDMEIASRHCNTPIEFTISIEDNQITYLVERNKSLYCCKSCNITYQNISQILDHSSSQHSSSQDLTENEYLSINVAKPDKSVNLTVNHETKKFICKKCDKNFSEVAALYRHVAVHVSNQRYYCDECGKSFPVYRYLSLHKLIHSRIRVYACKLCPKTFRAKDTLRTHEIVHHETNQNKLFICQVCGKGFVIDQYLKIHMKRHNKETGRICHICGKILKNEELCYKHIKEKHLIVSLKECEICHKTFHANRNLKAHMKLHGTRDLKCDQCEKEFFFKRDLKNHQLLHTGFRPHVCHYCGKDFRSLGALYKHVRTHTKVKPHVCSICQKAFSQLRSLQAHERVHSGHKPYRCQHCGKSYVQSNVFQQHMKKVHPGVIDC